ncbi:MAG: succinylglutamate desuccinylase/aspartoacylase family protein [Acidobacteria bacterium]|nr:succinylglutamate desuccinylase/aspartoacylase family protein [Acidobacteriota bacterium]
MPAPTLLDIQRIAPGTRDLFELQIARLPTHTAIELPIFVYKGLEAGPGLLVTAGLHGDEINGIEIIRRMIRNQQLMPDRGLVIAIPVVNIFGFIHSSRRLPEGKDLNRSFPGTSKGSLSSQVANVLMTRVVPLCQAVVDLHTGGGSKFNCPQVRCDFSVPDARSLARSFGARCIVHSKPPDQSFRKEVSKRNIACVTYEGGESMRLDEDAIQVGLSGVRRVLKHLNMQNNDQDEAGPRPEYPKTSWIRAPHTGIFNARVTPGQLVSRSHIVGVVADPFGEREIVVKAKTKGLVIGVNHRCVIHRGEALVHLGVTS